MNDVSVNINYIRLWLLTSGCDIIFGRRWASQVKKLPQVQVKSDLVTSLDLTCKDFAGP
jgi:hypothetical protein